MWLEKMILMNIVEGVWGNWSTAVCLFLGTGLLDFAPFVGTCLQGIARLRKLLYEDYARMGKLVYFYFPV